MLQSVGVHGRLYPCSILTCSYGPDDGVYAMHSAYMLKSPLPAPPPLLLAALCCADLKTAHGCCCGKLYMCVHSAHTQPHTLLLLRLLEFPLHTFPSICVFLVCVRSSVLLVFCGYGRRSPVSVAVSALSASQIQAAHEFFVLCGFTII